MKPLKLLLLSLSTLTPFPQPTSAQDQGTGTKKIIIPTTSFSSRSLFEKYWSYNYPWGTDHNGAARMSASQVALSNTTDGTGVELGTLTLTAKRVSGQKPATHGGKQIAIKYLSGTVWAKEPYITVGRVVGSGFDFDGEFRATTTRGTWPAFWLTGVKGVSLVLLNFIPLFVLSTLYFT